MSSSLPVYTLLVTATSLLVFGRADVESMLIFDRSAILNGELWRLWSGHSIHFSNTHLAYDLLAFGLAGGLLEYRAYPGLPVLYLLMAMTISLVLLLFRPEMAYYGGLSGLACGAVVYLALHGLHKNSALRLPSAAILVFMLVKIVAELCTSQSLLPTGEQGTAITMPLSHLTGAAVALMFWGVGNIRREARSSFALLPRVAALHTRTK